MKYFFIITSLFFLLMSCKDSKKSSVASDVYYTCSMHPQIIQNKPGNCPICGMQLIQMNKNKSENSDEIKLSNEQIDLGNIKTDTIASGVIGDQIVLPATINFDQMKTTSISSRIMGRVEKLYYKNTGEYIKTGMPLYDLYSEELNNSKQEYVLALERKKSFANQTTIDFDQLIQSARNKLLLWGMSDLQIAELSASKKSNPITTFYSNASGYITQLEIREGDYVMEGGTIVKLADLSSLWAEAQIYTSQMADIKPGSLASVRFPDLSNNEINGRIEFINPEINPNTRINLLRVSIPNTNNQYKPGMPAYVILKSPQYRSLTLPIDAVLRDSKGASVWIQTSPGSYKSMMVETGLESNGRIEIRSGVHAGDVVVVSGSYLLQSEFIFRKGANPMEGMKM